MISKLQAGWLPEKQFMIKLQNVSKEYKLDGENFIALNNISLQIKKGEFLAIVGPSGSGKSTLMHIIGLLDTPTKGKVYIDNQDVIKFDDNKLSQVRNEFVGFVFQQFNLINKLNVLENILLPAIYSKKQLDFDASERAMEIMKRFGIDDKAKSYPNKISGGQQQRVAIARALINRPQLILADEPTGNLDTQTGDKILRLLEELNKKDNITVVIVTHEKEVAGRTKRQITIRDGKLV